MIVHTIIAGAGVLRLGRSFGSGWTGCFLGGIAYAFGAPILCLYNNVIFLVGAAWIPWALAAIDRLLRRKTRYAAAELGIVLALQVLGGDPQAAFLTAACGAVYAVVLAYRPVLIPSSWSNRTMTFVAICTYVAVVLALAAAGIAPRTTSVTGKVVAAVWLAVAISLIRRWYTRPGEARLRPLLARLGGGCLLALALAAVQVVPAQEFASRSWRTAGIDSSTLYAYSLDPLRIAELIWPNVYGSSPFAGGSWLPLVSPSGGRETWVASIYLGGLTLMLASSVVQANLVGLGDRGWCSLRRWRCWAASASMVGRCGGRGSGR